jgi:hypothetical protein
VAATVTLFLRVLVISYAWLYAAFALVLTVAVLFDLTHVGDVLNVAAAIGATLGLFAYWQRKPVLPTAVWQGLFALIVVYGLVTVLLVLSTRNDPGDFHWLLGSTALRSKAYDVITVALTLPGLVTIWHLGHGEVLSA